MNIQYRPLYFLQDQDAVMSNPLGTICKLKPNPLHLHCAAVCAADYPLTKGLRPLKPPPDS